MKLFYADLSPYARKARMTVAEKGLGARVEMIEVVPYDLPAALVAANPLCKVPTLVTDDGDALFDSPVICEYLDSVGEGPSLMPSGGDARWRCLRRIALADGVLDYGFSISGEVFRRPENERSPKWIAHWLAAITRSVDQLEAEIAEWPGDFDLGHLGLCCALGYLDVRIKDHLTWREGRPALTAWFEGMQARDSLRDSAPKV